MTNIQKEVIIKIIQAGLNDGSAQNNSFALVLVGISGQIIVSIFLTGREIRLPFRSAAFFPLGLKLLREGLEVISDTFNKTVI